MNEENNLAYNDLGFAQWWDASQVLTIEEPERDAARMKG